MVTKVINIFRHKKPVFILIVEKYKMSIILKIR